MNPAPEDRRFRTFEASESPRDGPAPLRMTPGLSRAAAPSVEREQHVDGRDIARLRAMSSRFRCCTNHSGVIGAESLARAEADDSVRSLAVRVENAL
jgi:hypothetical protein